MKKIQANEVTKIYEWNQCSHYRVFALEDFPLLAAQFLQIKWV